VLLTAKIVSVSLSEALLDKLDAASAELGFSGRSEAVRAGVNALLDEAKSSELRGETECIMLVMHSPKGEDAVTRAKHDYEGIIRTQLHSNLSNGKCMEIFVLNGPAEKIKEFYHKVRATKKVESVRLVVA